MLDSVTVKRLNEIDVKSILAWGSISYAFGFVTVMLHTARLGFPVLELLSAVYVWVGAPLTVIAFFSVQIARFFKARANKLTNELRESWKDFKEGVELKDVDVISQFFGILGAITPIETLLLKPFESLLRRISGDESKTSDRDKRFLGQMTSFFRGGLALFELFRLLVTVSYLVGIVYLYVWNFYPLIPQSFGGGAPTTVKLLVNTEKIPSDVSDLLGIKLYTVEDHSQKIVVTGAIDLLYSTKNQYYLQGPKGDRLSLTKSIVHGVIWDSKN